MFELQCIQGYDVFYMLRVDKLLALSSEANYLHGTYLY